MIASGAIKATALLSNMGAGAAGMFETTMVAILVSAICALITEYGGFEALLNGIKKVFKGKKMPGHMGNVRVTVQNLEIVKIDVENNVILVKGAVPGPKKSLVMIKETVKTGK